MSESKLREKGLVKIDGKPAGPGRDFLRPSVLSTAIRYDLYRRFGWISSEW